MYEALQERGREWQVDGQAIVERLAMESQIWKYRVLLLQNQHGRKSTIPSASCVTWLKLFKLSTPYWGGPSGSTNEGADARTRSLQLLRLQLSTSLKPCAPEGRWGDRDASDPSYAAFRAPEVFRWSSSIIRFLKIQPELRGSSVSGIDFWASAPKGAGGSHSSSAGRRVLAAKYRMLLPP